MDPAWQRGETPDSTLCAHWCRRFQQARLVALSPPAVVWTPRDGSGDAGRWQRLPRPAVGLLAPVGCAAKNSHIPIATGSCLNGQDPLFWRCPALRGNEFPLLPAGSVLPAPGPNDDASRPGSIFLCPRSFPVSLLLFANPFPLRQLPPACLPPKRSPGTNIHSWCRGVLRRGFSA